MLTAGDVFDQAHDQAVFLCRVDDQRRDFGLPKCAIRLEAALTANQIEAIAVWARFTDYGDRPLETELTDILHDTIEHLAITCTRIDHRYLIERNLLDTRGRTLFRHLRSLSFVRAAIS